MAIASRSWPAQNARPAPVSTTQLTEASPVPPPAPKTTPAKEADAKAAYVYAIRQRIQSRWVAPPTATAGIECIVNIRQLPGGEVVSVSIGRCNGDAAVRRSIETAVYRASPLPNPPDPSVFDRNIVLEFRPRD